VRCTGEHVGEHIENPMRTHWELKGNIVGTNLEKMKKKFLVFLITYEFILWKVENYHKHLRTIVMCKRVRNL
jgi:hypothetical protein